MPDAPSGLTRLDRLLPALERLSGATLRVWSQAEARTPEQGVHVLAGPTPAWTVWLNGTRDSGTLETPEGPAWFERVPDAVGVWLEIRDGGREKGDGTRQALRDIVGAVLATEHEAAQVAAELSERYEEIDLIYTISEILGHTIRLD